MLNKIVLTLALVAAQLISLAQADGYAVMKNVDDFKSKAKAVANKTNSISSDFVQKKVLSIMEEEIVSKGKFLFKKENSIRWEYKEPFVYLIIINDGEIFIKDENKENKFDMKSNKTFKGINDMIVNSVSGNIMDDDNYAVSYYESAAGYMVQLIPKDDKLKEYMSTIQVFFDKTSYDVVKVKMIEESEDYTSIEFKNRVVNSEVSDDKFSFK
ncbi:MAG: outer membrane lipoprotein carrier protein LolA [Flavobacteriales bacterium]|jgi:outer membrane lipoprotein-sorting protein|nr:outer membrane lipoprotein carrier protein LolA [Flavobacteriales bacterium]MBT6745002.1 outer membrane lipoprotein carrier protein LolA [Flavobacteriales bacterium]